MSLPRNGRKEASPKRKKLNNRSKVAASNACIAQEFSHTQIGWAATSPNDIQAVQSNTRPNNLREKSARWSALS